MLFVLYGYYYRGMEITKQASERDTTFHRAKNVSWTQMDDSLVILDPRGERYFHELSPVASFIWLNLDGKSKSELTQIVQQEFDVSEMDASKDLDEFLVSLKENNLLSN